MCHNVKFRYPENYILECTIWEGISHYKSRILLNSILPIFDGCMLIYSINSLESFNECKNYWKPTLLEKCEEDIKVMLSWE